MKKRKNSGLILAARMAAGRAARRIGARVAVAGKRVARKYGKRLATYGVNELESRGQKLLETASGSARQRIARMNPEIFSSTVSKAEVDEILRSIYRKYYSDKKLKKKFQVAIKFGSAEMFIAFSITIQSETKCCSLSTTMTAKFINLFQRLR
jgi:hypothetical protein